MPAPMPLMTSRALTSGKILPEQWFSTFLMPQSSSCHGNCHPYNYLYCYIITYFASAMDHSANICFAMVLGNACERVIRQHPRVSTHRLRNIVLYGCILSIISVNLWWFGWEDPIGSIFGYLLSSWQNYLGRARGCGLVGGMGFLVSKAHAIPS